jgi:hypothetical protein
VNELSALFLQAGFTQFRSMMRIRGHFIGIPSSWLMAGERAISAAGIGIRRKLRDNRLFRIPFGNIYMIGTK